MGRMPGSFLFGRAELSVGPACLSQSSPEIRALDLAQGSGDVVGFTLAISLVHGDGKVAFDGLKAVGDRECAIGIAFVPGIGPRIAAGAT